MFPGSSAKQNNKYIDILVDNLTDKSCDVESWDKYKPFQTGDIFHIHWPELLVWLWKRPYRSIEGRYFMWNFFNTIQRVKKSNGIIVWTVHNLSPHELDVKNDDLYEKVMSLLLPNVDAYFMLTDRGKSEVVAAYPMLKNINSSITQHPSYQDVLEPCPFDILQRIKVGISEDSWVCSLLGDLRPNKKADLATKVFANLDSDKYHLILGGGISESYKKQLNDIIEGRSNFITDYGYLTDDKMSMYYSMTDALAFPSTDYFNSGTIYTALSLDIPVIAARTPTNEDIQEKVGGQWLYLFDGEFNEQVIISASHVLVSRNDGFKCDMNYFSPNNAANAILEGYEVALEYARKAV
jgi:glycosyltransferase involved in cell wall biosynthesis